jgi:hypothetical protein
MGNKKLDFFIVFLERSETSTWVPTIIVH